LLKKLQNSLNDTQLTYTETLQPLWSGYGKISRYYSPKLATSVIVKSVTPPHSIIHPRGWHSEVAHQRKLTSYTIEANFYQTYAKDFVKLCPKSCYIPQIINFSKSHEYSKSQEKIETQVLVMEDLQHLGFHDKNSPLSLTDIKAVIHWLANFHARFIGHKADNLWPVGTYWYLETRQDELNNMQDGPLKQAAHFIDSTLNNVHYQTIVHGDAKLANFCFSGANNSDEIDNKEDNQRGNKLDNTSKRIAAVDFQYVGKGIGVKDLAYFLGSGLTDNDLTKRHNELLNYYFDELSQACIDYKQDINFSALEKEWRKLYSFANADFHRFLQGWSPKHQKINNYLQRQTNLALRYYF